MFISFFSSFFSVLRVHLRKIKISKNDMLMIGSTWLCRNQYDKKTNECRYRCAHNVEIRFIRRTFAHIFDSINQASWDVFYIDKARSRKNLKFFQFYFPDHSQFSLLVSGTHSELSVCFSHCLWFVWWAIYYALMIAHICNPTLITIATDYKLFAACDKTAFGWTRGRPASSAERERWLFGLFFMRLYIFMCDNTKSSISQR